MERRGRSEGWTARGELVRKAASALTWQLQLPGLSECPLGLQGAPRPAGRARVPRWACPSVSDLMQLLHDLFLLSSSFFSVLSVSPQGAQFPETRAHDVSYLQALPQCPRLKGVFLEQIFGFLSWPPPWHFWKVTCLGKVGSLVLWLERTPFICKVSV